MLCRRMIDHNVHHYFQPSFMCFMKKIFEIICCSVNRVYIIVICNIISVIITRTYIYRCQPYIFYPQLCNIRKPADYPVNISYSVTITVLKAFWINLIYTHLFIICHLFLLYTNIICHSPRILSQTCCSCFIITYLNKFVNFFSEIKLYFNTTTFCA